MSPARSMERPCPACAEPWQEPCPLVNCPWRPPVDAAAIQSRDFRCHDCKAITRAAEMPDKCPACGWCTAFAELDRG
jgi:hypothetical protein